MKALLKRDLNSVGCSQMAMSKSPLALKPNNQQSSSSTSTSQAPSDNKMHPLPASSSGSKARRNSLRLSLQQTPPVPIPPPSLLQSPYLTGSKVHKEPATTSHIPSEEEDFWLQDQVPLSAVGRRRTLPAQPRDSMSSVRQQSPPLTPPVRPHSVLATCANYGLSHGDWAVPPLSSSLGESMFEKRLQPELLVQRLYL